jgi:LEA14-like dessication related protein
MKATFSKRTWPFFAFIFLLIFMSSCQVENVEFVDISSVQVKDMNANEMFLDVRATLNNPNNFAIKIIESDLDLFLEGSNMGKARLIESFTLEGGEKAYDLKVRAEGKNLQMKMIPLILSAALTGKVTVKLDGDITGRVALMKKKVNVSITEEVKFKKES